MISGEEFDEPDEPPEPNELLRGGEDDDDDDNNNDEGDDMVLDDSSDEEEFVDFDPSGRYGRYSEMLGKGAMKTVYRAYDMTDCKEVAWNKARPPVECSDEQAVAVQREIHILQGLHHQGIIKLYSAWVDANDDTNFITELCSSTLLEYRLKHKHISRKAVKTWGRQILKGLAHLHTQDPPIIHRDLKCENIFVKCRSNTDLKIGDFGSATFLDETHHMHTLVGTPEFMAPEMFQEDYNELVDVYSFGMCMLELLTRECPYSECKSLGQIYKKVMSGEKPKALQKVTDMQALRLINRCLLPACKRPSASELLSDPFFQPHDGCTSSGQSMKSSTSMPNLRAPTSNIGVKNMLSGQGVINKLARPSAATRRDVDHVEGVGRDLSLAKPTDPVHKRGLCTKSPSFRRTYRVMGRVEDEYTLRLKIRIQESSRSCDIDFPFDLRFDSPKSVAEEMVRTLDYSESDLATITDLIREEIATLLPTMEDRFTVQSPAFSRRVSMSELSVDAGLSSGQFSCSFSSSPWELNRKADEKRNDMLSEGLLCCEDYEKGNAMFAEGDPTGENNYRNNSFHSCCTEQASSVSNEANKNVLLDCPCMLSPTSFFECNTLHNNTDVAVTNPTSDGSSRVCNDCGIRKRNDRLRLPGNMQSPPHSFSKSRSSKFKQLPAGIGILLRPSTEQALRRALPSCINASA